MKLLITTLSMLMALTLYSLGSAQTVQKKSLT